MLFAKLKMTFGYLGLLAGVVVILGIVAHRSPADSASDRSPTNGEALTSARPEPRAPANVATPPQREQPKAGPQVAGKLEAVDADKLIVKISTFSRQNMEITETTYVLAKDAKILQDARDAKLKDLKTGNGATLELSADQRSVVSISVTGPTIQAPVKAVAADKGTITITQMTRNGNFDKTYQVAKHGKVVVDGKAATLADLKEGTMVTLTVSVENENTVIEVRTPGSPKRNER
jgi:hypothetical protein